MSMSKYDIVRDCIGDKIDKLGMSDDDYLELMRLIDILYDAAEESHQQSLEHKFD